MGTGRQERRAAADDGNDSGTCVMPEVQGTDTFVQMGTGGVNQQGERRKKQDVFCLLC